NSSSPDWQVFYFVVTTEVEGVESVYSNEVSGMSQVNADGSYDATYMQSAVPGPIVAWPDKTGFTGRNLAGTATLVAAAQNGKNGVQFDGIANILSTTL